MIYEISTFPYPNNNSSSMFRPDPKPEKSPKIKIRVYTAKYKRRLKAIKRVSKRMAKELSIYMKQIGYWTSTALKKGGSRIEM